jgi:hypothetical protein
VAGIIVMWGGLVSAIPSGWVLCNGANGTPDLRSKFVKGAANGADPGATGGAATHGHTVTQPGDHAALSHSGTTVGNHAFTQPGAHSAHVFTQPGAHSAHVVTQPTAANESSHTHTGASAGTTPKLFTSNTSSGVPGVSAGGSAHTHSMSGSAVDAHSAHSGGAVDAHSAHSGGAVDAHTVGQGSQHAAQSHSGASVDTVNSEPAYYALCFIQKT